MPGRCPRIPGQDGGDPPRTRIFLTPPWISSAECPFSCVAVPKCTARDREVTPCCRVLKATATRAAVETSANDMGAGRFERWMNCSTHAVVSLPQTSDTLEPVLPALLLCLWAE